MARTIRAPRPPQAKRPYAPRPAAPVAVRTVGDMMPKPDTIVQVDAGPNTPIALAAVVGKAKSLEGAVGTEEVFVRRPDGSAGSLTSYQIAELAKQLQKRPLISSDLTALGALSGPGIYVSRAGGLGPTLRSLVAGDALEIDDTTGALGNITIGIDTAAVTTTVNANSLLTFTAAIFSAKPRAVTTIKLAAGTYTFASLVRFPAWADLVIRPADGLSFGDVIVQGLFDYGHGSRVEWKLIDFRHGAVASNMHTGFLGAVTFSDCDCLADDLCSGKFWFSNNLCAVTFRGDTRTSTYDYSRSLLSTYIVDQRYGGYAAAEYISLSTRNVVFKGASDILPGDAAFPDGRNAPRNGPLVYLVSQNIYTDNMSLTGGTTGSIDPDPVTGLPPVPGISKTNIGLLINRGCTGVFNGAGPGAIVSNCTIGINCTRGSKFHIGGSVEFVDTNFDWSGEPGSEVTWDQDTVRRFGSLQQDELHEGMALRSFAIPGMAIYGARMTTTSGQDDFNAQGWNGVNPQKGTWVQEIGTAVYMTGMTGGYDGRLALLEQPPNAKHPFLLVNESPDSIAANRFMLNGAGERGHHLLLPGDKIELIYDATSMGPTTVTHPVANWATATAYVVDDIVKNNILYYVCMANHTSSTGFATDLDLVRWEKIGRWTRKQVTGLTRQTWRRVAMLPGSAGEVRSAGIEANVVTGTVTHPAPTIGSYRSGARRATISTGASAGDEAMLIGDQLSFYQGDAAGRGGYVAHFIFSLGAWPGADGSFFVGMYGALTDPGDVNSNTFDDCIGVGCNPGDTTLEARHNDADDVATDTDHGAGFPISVGPVYEMWIVAMPNGGEVTRCTWRLDDTSVAPVTGRLTTNIPAGTKFLTPAFWVANRAGAADYSVEMLLCEVFTPN